MRATALPECSCSTRCRILVNGCVHAAPARVIDELQRLDTLAPVAAADNLVVCHLRWEAAALADGNGFFTLSTTCEVSSRMCEM